jgi:hypothetical protein
MNPTGHESHFQSATDWRGDESTEGDQPRSQDGDRSSSELATGADSTPACDGSGHASGTAGYEPGYDAYQPQQGEAPQSESQRDSDVQYEETRENYSQYDDPQFAESVYQPQSPCADEGQVQNGEATSTYQKGESDYPYRYEYTYPCERYGYGKGMEGGGAETAQNDAERAEPSAECEQPNQDAGEYQPADSSPMVARGPEPSTPSFAWLPGELLAEADQTLLRTVARQVEERPETRRAVLDDYLEALGFEARDFARRLEDSTGVEALGLVDNLPGLAALLGTFRLVEQGQLGVDQGVEVLSGAIWNLPEPWIDGVEQISTREENPDPPAGGTTTTSTDDVQAERTLIKAIESLATRSLSDFDEAFRNISRQIAALAGETFVGDAPADAPVHPAADGGEEFPD